MRFMILVMATKESEAGAMPTEAKIAEMATYHEELAKAGVLLDARGLKSTARGWRVRYDGQKRAIVDGPFAESKELVAGYTIIQTQTREEAVKWTRRFPNPTPDDSAFEIEVRELFEAEDFADNKEHDRFVALRQELEA